MRNAWIWIRAAILGSLVLAIGESAQSSFIGLFS